MDFECLGGGGQERETGTTGKAISGTVLITLLNHCPGLPAGLAVRRRIDPFWLCRCAAAMNCARLLDVAAGLPAGLEALWLCSATFRVAVVPSLDQFRRFQIRPRPPRGCRPRPRRHHDALAISGEAEKCAAWGDAQKGQSQCERLHQRCTCQGYKHGLTCLSSTTLRCGRADWINTRRQG